MRHAFWQAVVWMHLTTAALFAAERDILEIAKENPLHIWKGGTPAEYGDPNLARAVHGLADIAHPWTVPGIIELYRQERASWSAMLRDKTYQQKPREWDKAEQRIGYLATLLAASRDPRAAVELMTALQDQMRPGNTCALEGMKDYFLPDAKYRRLKATPQVGNMLIFWAEDVRAWWRLNQEAVELAARAATD